MTGQHWRGAGRFRFHFLSEGRPRMRITVENTHAGLSASAPTFHSGGPTTVFDFDRDAAHGYHLDIPAGSTVRWAPGETHEVELVRFGGTGGFYAGQPLA